MGNSDQVGLLKILAGSSEKYICSQSVNSFCFGLIFFPKSVNGLSRKIGGMSVYAFQKNVFCRINCSMAQGNTFFMKFKICLK